MNKVVFITSEPLDLVPAQVLHGLDSMPLTVLGLNGGETHRFPRQWSVVEPGELAETSELREEFFRFLEAWPDRAGGSGRSLNACLANGDGYSIWWTTAAADRQNTRGIVKYLSDAVLVDRMLRRESPDTVLLWTKDPVFAALVHSRARGSGIAITSLEGSAKPRVYPVRLRAGWLLRSLQHALGAPLQSLALAIRCKRALRRVGPPRTSTSPTVVFASTWPRHFALGHSQLSRVYWEEIGAALERADPNIRQVYLPRRLDQIVDAGNSRAGLDAVRDVRAPLLIWERFFPVGACVSRVARQIRLLWRFHRVTQRPAFAESFRFAGADLAPVLFPELKAGVARAIDWSLKSAQVRAALRATGGVNAMLVSEEMYQPAMPTLAAASALGIPTIGVQHGTIMPTHFTYTLPRGHVEHAPVPDYFCAYGEYGKEVLSRHGAYPADRVWTTGAARLDPLITRLPDRSAARAALDLPPDRKIVVLATQTFPWFISAMRAVLECMREHPEALLCVKRNPSIHAMPLSEIDAMAAEIGVTNVRGFEMHPELLLSACDVWISASSTTLLEATLIGRATICLNFSGQPDRYPYVEEGVSIPARGGEELQAALARVLAPGGESFSEERRRAFLERHLGPTVHGRAADTLARRVADLIASRS